MSFQAQRLQLLQIGKESTYGTPVAANKRLLSLKADLDPKFFQEEDLAEGVKASVGEIVGKEWGEIGLSGNAAYNDLAYLLSMLLCAPVIATPGGGTNSRTFTFTPSMTAADSFNSFTIQKGAVGDAAIVAGLRLDELELTIDPGKAGVDLKGKAIGKAISDGNAFTSNPTLIPKKSLNGKQVSVFLAADTGDLATSQVRPLEVKWSVKDRHTPVFSVDDTESSFENTVEKGFMSMAQLTFPKGSDTNGYLDDLRNSETKFLQIISTGPIIEGSIPYMLDITMPFNFASPKRQAKSDVACEVYDLKAVYDSTFGGALTAVLTLGITAL